MFASGRALLAALSAAVILAAFGTPVLAEDAYPSKPVHIYVPYPPGGAVDIVARTLGDALGKAWNQSVVIENRPGAAGIIAEQALVQAAPDGYTLILVASGHALLPHFYEKLPYDTFKDFTPISQIGSSPNMLLVRDDSPFKSVSDVIAAARAKPGALSYGHAGNGTSPYLSGELFKYMAKIQITPVPYKGGAPVLTDLIGGQIPLSFNNIPESLGQVQAGAVRPLGVTTAERSPILPNVPTIAETGVPGYDTGVWWGVFAPAGLPAAIQSKIAKDCADAVKTPAMQAKLKQLGATPIGSTSDALAKATHDEYEKWGPVIKAAGLKIE
ncbi:MAG TPA: tripartite tricarboxylate transporter substrate binding protein [Xanthobacteraceae bacterium]|jgi:tripartite-type tricarboxylate transporter receptor subunit TctC|nr:tripartite tricarboxylate transporter substrate binding protein [Xanthobacteraceae bacterium]